MNKINKSYKEGLYLMEIQQLKGFVAVARYKGFTKAATKTFRSQPAISLQIQSLEDEFQTKLIERSRSGEIDLTEQGRILYEIISPLVEELDSVRPRFMEACKGSVSGSLKIATHTSVMVHLLPDAVRDFQRRFSDVELTIMNRSREDILSMIRHGEVDFGITSLTTVPNGLDYQVFASFRRVIIFPKDHPLKRKKKVQLTDLSNFRLIIPPIESSTRTAVDKAFKREGIEYKLAMEVTGREAIKTYVRMGLGISVINEYYLSEDDRKSLVVKDGSGFFGMAERGIITKKGKYLSNAAKSFIELLNH